MRNSSYVGFNSVGPSDWHISGDGTIQFGDGAADAFIRVGWDSNNGDAVDSPGYMSVSGVVFNAYDMHEVLVGKNYYKGTGTLDLAHATVVSGTDTNVLRIVYKSPLAPHSVANWQRLIAWLRAVERVKTVSSENAPDKG